MVWVGEAGVGVAQLGFRKCSLLQGSAQIYEPMNLIYKFMEPKAKVRSSLGNLNQDPTMFELQTQVP